MPILSPSQISEFAWAAGFRNDGLRIAVAVALAESGGRTEAVGDTTLQNSTWGPSIGLWQIRSLNAQKGTKGERDELANYEPLHNAKAAYAISGGGSNWKPWSVYTNGSYKKYLDAAGGAASSTTSRGGSAGSITQFIGDSSYAVPPPIALPVEPIALKEPKNLIILGKDLSEEQSARIVGGSIEMTNDQIPQISITFLDEDYNIWSAPWKTQGTAVNWDDWKLELAGASGDERDGVFYTTIQLWPRGVAALRAKTGTTRRSLTAGNWITAEANAVGMTVVNYEARGIIHDVISSEKTDDQIEGLTYDNKTDVQEPESAWDTMRRLGKEDGCILYALPEATIVFGRPSIIVRALPYFDAGFRGSVNGDPALNWTRISPEVTVQTTSTVLISKRATIWLPRSRGERLRPGHAGRLPGFPSFDDGNYLVSSVRWDLMDINADVEVDLEVPIDPAPQPQTQEDSLGPLVGEIGTSAPGGLNKGTKNANDFVAFAQAQAGDKYVFGAAPAANIDNPSSFDCSGLVQWAAAQVGIKLPRTSDAQLSACVPISIEEASKTRGALIGKRGSGADGHVVISLGDGRHTIEARGSRYGVVNYLIPGRGFDAAGLIRGMNYGTSIAYPQRDAQTQGFNGPVGPEHITNKTGFSQGAW